MTTLDALQEQLEDYKTAFYRIADHIEGQKALEQHQKSTGISWQCQEAGRVAAYRDISRIVAEVLKRHVHEPVFVPEGLGSQRVH